MGLLSVTGIVWPNKASEPAKPPPCSERGTLRPTFSKGITATSMAIYLVLRVQAGSEVIYCDGIYFGVG